MAVKALEKILHNGKNYSVGDVIPDLTEEEKARLIKLKAGEEFASDGKQEPVDPDDKDDDFSGFQLNGQTVLSVEEFSELKADEQKAHLKALMIEPAGKEEERIAQYEEWYADQVTAADNN